MQARAGSGGNGAAAGGAGTPGSIRRRASQPLADLPPFPPSMNFVLTKVVHKQKDRGESGGKRMNQYELLKSLGVSDADFAALFLAEHVPGAG